jgi:hypothetical protein
LVGAAGRYVVGVGDEEHARGPDGEAKLADADKQSRLNDLLSKLEAPPTSAAAEADGGK